MHLFSLMMMISAAVVGGMTCFQVPRMTPRTRLIWAGQLVVLLAGAAACAYAGQVLPDVFGGPFGASLGGDPVARAVAALAAAGAAALGGSAVTTAVLELSRRSDRREPGEAVSSAKAENDTEAVSTLHGGLWIGVLERVGVGAVLLAGWPTGLTVMAAIKALGRFTELKDPDAVERFILGTLASFLWAGAWAGTAWLWSGGLVG